MSNSEKINKQFKNSMAMKFQNLSSPTSRSSSENVFKAPPKTNRGGAR